MTAMDFDPQQHRLLTLIDHPPQDAEPPRNPVLTHQVMERVRHDHARAHAQATSRAERHDARPWLLGVVLVSVLALLAPSTGVLSDGGLSEAASLFDAELVFELVLGAVIAAGILALSWRRLV
jgi:hypothetical protein